MLKYTKTVVTIVLCLISIDASAQGLLQRYKQCVELKRSQLAQPKTFVAFENRGCTTKHTAWDGTRYSCDEDVCYESPPNTIILGARVWDASGAGSEHSYGETRYLPTRDAATKICNSVHARGGSGPYGGRGWQKLSAEVTIQPRPTDSQLREIEASCEKDLGG
jgi:hypothetical protein